MSESDGAGGGGGEASAEGVPKASLAFGDASNKESFPVGGDPAHGDLRRTGQFKGHVGEVLSLAASAARATLLSGGEDGARLWSCKDRSCVTRLQPPKGVDFADDEVAAVAYSPTDEHTVYTASEQTIRCYDLRNAGSPTAVLTMNADDISQLSVSPDGRYIAAADDAGSVRVIDAATRQSFKSLSRGGHESICSSAIFRRGKPWELVRCPWHTSTDPIPFSRLTNEFRCAHACAF
jgi:WD40 repeat protein